MIPAYYNEHDEYPAQWLRNLIAAGHIPAGDVDTRSIADVQPDDLTAYGQCHFFAGIGGRAWAARLARWPDDRELWTGSAPCQPFSAAGHGKGKDDDRHLWPHLFRLVSARRPAVLMGEQVAAAIGHDWLDGVSVDLDGIGYACRAAVVPACAVNAPHRRSRIWFVADASGERGPRRPAREEPPGSSQPGQLCSGNVADADVPGLGASRRGEVHSGRPAPANAAFRDESAMADTDGQHAGMPGDAGAAEGQRREHGPDSGDRGAWDDSAWIVGHDGKARRVKPGVRLLAHGIPARVGKLRAHGNAIVPEEAAQVIGAYMDCMP